MKAVRFLLLVSLISCNSNKENGSVGPCVHIYKEAILHIDSVKDMQTGNYLTSITLTQIQLDSIKINPSLLTPVGVNVIAHDSVLMCSVPCSFGTESHEYKFKVSADGYVDTIISCFPIYTINKGGCPSSSDGGLHISFKMRQTDKIKLRLPNQSLKLTREARHENSFSVESNMRLVVHSKCNPRAA
jgi:hypothetical protein